MTTASSQRRLLPEADTMLAPRACMSSAFCAGGAELTEASGRRSTFHGYCLIGTWRSGPRRRNNFKPEIDGAPRTQMRPVHFTGTVWLGALERSLSERRFCALLFYNDWAAPVQVRFCLRHGYLLAVT
jgi:hypothetical protein